MSYTGTGPKRPQQTQAGSPRRTRATWDLPNGALASKSADPLSGREVHRPIMPPATSPGRFAHRSIKTTIEQLCELGRRKSGSSFARSRPSDRRCAEKAIHLLNTSSLARP
jgi:hypothetical protein